MPPSFAYGKQCGDNKTNPEEYWNFCFREMHYRGKALGYMELGTAFDTWRCTNGLQKTVGHERWWERDRDLFFQLCAAAHVKIGRSDAGLKRALKAFWLDHGEEVLDILSNWLRRGDAHTLQAGQLPAAAVEEIRRARQQEDGRAGWWPVHGPDLDQVCLTGVITEERMLEEWVASKSDNAASRRFFVAEYEARRVSIRPAAVIYRRKSQRDGDARREIVAAAAPRAVRRGPGERPELASATQSARGPASSADCDWEAGDDQDWLSEHLSEHGLLSNGDEGAHGRHLLRLSTHEEVRAGAGAETTLPPLRGDDAVRAATRTGSAASPASPASTAPAASTAAAAAARLLAPPLATQQNKRSAAPASPAPTTAVAAPPAFSAATSMVLPAPPHATQQNMRSAAPASPAPEAGDGGDGGESEGGSEGGGGDPGMDDGDSRNADSAGRCVNLCTFKRVVVERLHSASRSLPGL